MKIGTLTYHHQQNYGGVLQAYALQQALQKIAVDSEIVDYRFPGSAPKMMLHSFSEASLLKSKMRRGVEKFFFDKHIKTRIEKTRHFLENDVVVSERIYENEKELPTALEHYDGFIVGSDQIWNRNLPGATDAYLLDFVPTTHKKISYAGSFGTSSLAPEHVPRFRDALQTFDAISVREEQGVDIVKEASDKEATWVLDPTLLLNRDDWAKLTSSTRPRKEDYILCYFIGPSGKPAIHIFKEVEKRYKMPIVHIGLNSRKEYLQRRFKYVIDAGPRDFVNYIRHASAVITNSFHGSIFSLIFGKPLCVVTHTNPARQTMHSRFEVLIKHFGIQDCMQNANEPFSGEIVSCCNTFNEVLSQKQKDSFAFLKNALGLEDASLA